MGKKVNFSDYSGHKAPPVPPEAHSLLRKVLGRFASGTVMAAFEDVVQNKLFGDLQIIHPGTQRVVARFEFHSGICKKYDFIRCYRDGRRVGLDFEATPWEAEFTQSIFNDDVNFSRNKLTLLEE